MIPLLLVAALAVPKAPVDVLANVRAALKAPGPAWSQTVLVGQAEFRGVSDRYRLEFGDDGRFRQQIDGKVGQTNGYDGTTYWEIDSSGATRRLAFEDVDRAETLAMLLTDRWLDSSAPVDRAVKTSGGAYVVTVSLHVSGLEETLHVDPATWLPTSAEFEMAATKIKIALSDWREAGARKVPFTARVTEAGLTDTYHVESAAKGGSQASNDYAMPSLTPSNLAYDAAVPALVESRRAPTGHILVHPQVNGKDVGWFILDSGADSMVIDSTTADSLSLPKIGKESVVGVGGVVQEPFRTVSSFRIGPASMRDVNFVEFDLHELSGFFKVKLAGIVGFDFFRRFIVQVNLKQQTVEVDNVTDFHLPRGTWSNMEFSSGNPAVQATFEGDRKGWFRLDTGANGTVTFHAPAVRRMHLLEGRQTDEVGMAGVGGTTAARSGKLAWFELGGHRFENVVADFSLAKDGAFADRYLTGNIGQDLMEPFTVVFDFGGSRVAFLPN